MRQTLQQAKRLGQGMTDEQVREEFSRYRSDQQDEKGRAEQRREAQVKTVLKRQTDEASAARQDRSERIREHVRAAGLDPTGLSDAELDRYAHEQSTRQADLEARLWRSRKCFGASGCPLLQTENIDAVDSNPRWHEIHDLLARRAGEGYLVALLGSSGTGKTQMAVNVIKLACDAGIACRYVTAMDLFREVRQAATAGREKAASELEVINAWAEVGLIAIDDLHQRSGTDFEQNTLINLLDRRYAAKRSTILIANQTKEAFAAAVGDSIVSRIYETGEAFWCDWPSYRKPGAWRESR